MEVQDAIKISTTGQGQAHLDMNMCTAMQSMSGSMQDIMRVMRPGTNIWG